MKLNHLALPALAVVLAATNTALHAQQPYGPPPPPQSGYYGQGGYGQGGWDGPPPEFREIQRQGFRDGIDGAHHDMDNHRQPNVNNRDEYRHPHVPGRDRRDYKMAFSRGYAEAWQHGNFGPGDRDHDRDHDHDRGGSGYAPRPY